MGEVRSQLKKWSCFQQLQTAVDIEIVTHALKEENSTGAINTWKFYKNNQFTHEKFYYFHLETPFLILHSKELTGFCSFEGGKSNSRVWEDAEIWGFEGRQLEKEIPVCSNSMFIIFQGLLATPDVLPLCPLSYPLLSLSHLESQNGLCYTEPDGDKFISITKASCEISSYNEVFTRTK